MVSESPCIFPVSIVCLNPPAQLRLPAWFTSVHLVEIFVVFCQDTWGGYLEGGRWGFFLLEWESMSVCLPQ